MYCPQCRDEFRSGFSRCATCDVELVEDLDAAAVPAPEHKEASRHAAVAPQMLEYCGFLELEEARDARELLRAESIRADILIREAPDAGFDQPISEEFWLRIDSHGFRRASGLLGASAAADLSEGSAECQACGLAVSRGERVCPACGGRP